MILDETLDELVTKGPRQECTLRLTGASLRNITWPDFIREHKLQYLILGSLHHETSWESDHVTVTLQAPPAELARAVTLFLQTIQPSADLHQQG